jgi:hypothetical protein
MERVLKLDDINLLGGGLYKLESSVTHSLRKAPGFNPRAYEVKNWWFPPTHSLKGAWLQPLYL